MVEILVGGGVFCDEGIMVAGKFVGPLLGIDVEVEVIGSTVVGGVEC